jgi:hypothetical protein
MKQTNARVGHCFLHIRVTKTKAEERGVILKEDNGVTYSLWAFVISSIK